ncbi:MAG: glycosyltransferase family 4 protein [Phycisphaerae bacterium]|nr:glycosyltransferase family 4 protein [Phycisphaerae bacterium]
MCGICGIVDFKEQATSAAKADRVCPKDNSQSKKPRVVMLGPLPPLTGGMAAVVNNLRDSALASRCRLTVLNNGKTTPEGRSVLSGIASQMGLLYRLAETILRQRAQIVHIHTCSGFTFWRDCLHALVASLLGSHVVWHVHGGGFDVFAAQQARIGKAIMRFALTRASAVIALSEDWVGRLRAIAPRAKWRVVPNGVPISPKTVVVENRKPTFLFLGNLGEQKGAHDLVRATAIASRKGFEGQIDLAGKETEPGQIEAIEKIIAETGCQSQVRLIGVISGEAKDRAIKSADCMVLPSYAEGLPMAILEAMACGLLIISTNVGAIPEVITDGVEGFLIEPGDIEALADRLVRVGQDSQLRKRMGQAGKELVRQQYSLDIMINRLLDVYRDVQGKGLV